MTRVNGRRGFTLRSQGQKDLKFRLMTNCTERHVSENKIEWQEGQWAFALWLPVSFLPCRRSEASDIPFTMIDCWNLLQAFLGDSTTPGLEMCGCFCYRALLKSHTRVWISYQAMEKVHNLSADVNSQRHEGCCARSGSSRKATLVYTEGKQNSGRPLPSEKGITAYRILSR